MSKEDKGKTGKKEKREKKKGKSVPSVDAEVPASTGFSLFKGQQSQLDDIFSKGVSFSALGRARFR